MNRIHSRDIKVEGLDIRYLTGGHGTPLVIVHGGSDGASPWTRTLTELARNYTIFAPDMPGWGLSQPLEGDFYIPELVEFIESFARSIGLEKFYLVGHSLGGGVALSYALKYPHRVDKLVLVNSLCLSKDIALWVRLFSHASVVRSVGALSQAVFRGVKWFVDYVVAPLVQVNFVFPVSAVTMSVGAKVADTRQQLTVFADRLCEVNAPTLLVWGSRDRVVPVRQAYTAARLFPNCQLSVLDGGHSIYRENILEFSRVVGTFLG